MELIIFPRLSTRSKRAMLRTKKKWGHVYQYIPRRHLLERLKIETGMSEMDILVQIYQERKWLILHKQYFL